MKKKGYLLPENHEPEGYYTLCVHIPRDVEYLREFLGSLDHFGKWMAWEDDTGIRAKEAAAVWKVANELTRAAYASGECGDMPDFRINPETCLLEVDCSGDGDWQPVFTPATDPRTDITYPVPFPDPPPEGQSNECLSAANVAEYIWFAGDRFANQLDTGGLFAEFIALVMSVVAALFTLLSDIVIDATNTLFTNIDPETILADWSALDKQDFIDLFSCYLNADGSFPSGLWGDFLDELITLGGDNQAWYLVHYICGLMGWGGVNLAARLGGITEADCASCGFEHTDDMLTSMHGWLLHIFPPSDPYDPSATLGEWIDGEGVHHTLSAVQPAGGYRVLISQAIDTRRIDTVRVVAGLATGDNTTELYRVYDGVRTQINGSVTRDPMDSVPGSLYGTGADVTFDCGGVLFDQVEIYLSSANEYGYIRDIIITGRGDDPFSA